jgi:hypothetical protein
VVAPTRKPQLAPRSRETGIVMSSFTFTVLVVPAIGMCFAAGLFVITAFSDRRALRRADEWERGMSDSGLSGVRTNENPG